jgi:hypothetical protein
MDVDILYNVEKTCKVCNSTMKNYYYKKHIETKRHLLNIIKHLSDEQYKPLLNKSKKLKQIDEEPEEIIHNHQVAHIEFWVHPLEI